MKKIEVFSRGTTTLQVLTHYTMTDDFESFLLHKNKKILSVAYGFFNQFDLITYEV